MVVSHWYRIGRIALKLIPMKECFGDEPVDYHRKFKQTTSEKRCWKKMNEITVAWRHIEIHRNHLNIDSHKTKDYTFHDK